MNMDIENSEVQTVNRPWAQGVASLFMLVIGGLGISVVLRQNEVFNRPVENPSLILTFGLLGFLAAMGLWGLALTAIGWNAGEGALPGFLQAYRDAWRRLVGLRWLLILAGAVAVVNILGGLAEFALDRYYFAEYADRLFGRRSLSGLLDSAQGYPIIPILLGPLSGIVSRTPGSFLPDPGLTDTAGAGAFLAIVVLALLPWANRQLRSMRGVPGMEGSVAFFRRLIWPIGLIAAVSAPVQFYSLWYRYAAIAGSMASPSSTQPNEAVTIAIGIAAGILALVLQSLVISPLLIGGLAGSLQRVVSQNEVSPRSFFQDAMRFFAPVAGLFLLIEGVIVVIQMPTFLMLFPRYQDMHIWLSPYQQMAVLVWGLAMALLMFAPYVITAGALSVKRGLRGSIDAWQNCGYNLLSFTALGIAGLTVAGLVKYLAPLLAPFTSPYSIPARVIVILLDTGVSILMAVAVWEIYRRIRESSAEDVGESSETQAVQG